VPEAILGVGLCASIPTRPRDRRKRAVLHPRTIARPQLGEGAGPDLPRTVAVVTLAVNQMFAASAPANTADLSGVLMRAFTQRMLSVPALLVFVASIAAASLAAPGLAAQAPMLLAAMVGAFYITRSDTGGLPRALIVALALGIGLTCVYYFAIQPHLRDPVAVTVTTICAVLITALLLYTLARSRHLTAKGIWLVWMSAAISVILAFAVTYYEAFDEHQESFSNPGRGYVEEFHYGPHHKTIVDWRGDAFLSPIDAIYFSLTTFTTAGLGDITPRTEATRLAVSLELVCSLALISVGLARALDRG
jgi:hypothetical protein